MFLLFLIYNASVMSLPVYRDVGGYKLSHVYDELLTDVRSRTVLVKISDWRLKRL